MTAPARSLSEPGNAVRGHAAVGDRIRDTAAHGQRRAQVWRVVRVPEFTGDTYLVMNGAGVCKSSPLNRGWRFSA